MLKTVFNCYGSIEDELNSTVIRLKTYTELGPDALQYHIIAKKSKTSKIGDTRVVQYG